MGLWKHGTVSLNLLKPKSNRDLLTEMEATDVGDM